MTTWWLLAACAGCFAIKLTGYLVPSAALADPRVERLAGIVTVGLLSALVAVQTFGDDRAVALDARAAALGAAAVALMLRAPFIVVVITGALVAAGLRAL